MALKPRLPIINWNNPLTKGLFGNVPLFERGGSIASDIVGRLRGTVTGSPTWKLDLDGSSLNFRGLANADYILLKSGNILSGQVNATVVAYINPNQLPVEGVTSNWSVYVERGTSGNDIFGLEIAKGDGGGGAVNGSLRLTYRDDAGTLNQISTGSSVLTANRWTQVALVKAGTAITLYINGVSRGTGTLTATNNMTDASLQSRIGGDAQNAIAYFPGMMSSVLLYSRALIAQEIRMLNTNPWIIYQKPEFTFIKP